MNVNKTLYPDTVITENATFSNSLTQTFVPTTYIDKTIFYAGCNNEYLSRYMPENIESTQTGYGLQHTFKSAEPYKQDIFLGTSNYNGSLYDYFGAEHENGYHGSDITFINNFKFEECFIDLDEIYVNTISLEHANITGSDAVIQNDTTQYTMTDYLALEVKPLILSWSSLRVRGVENVTINPYFAETLETMNTYSAHCVSFNTTKNMYVNSPCYGGTLSAKYWFCVQSDWNNQSNTSLTFYKTYSNPTELSGGAVLGIPHDCTVETPIGYGETEYNYFIPLDYDSETAPLPILYYWSNWQCYYQNAYSFTYFLKMIASTGLRFKLGGIMYASEIRADGYTTGRYVKVSELDSSDFANKEWLTNEDSVFDADKKPDKELDNDLKDIGLNDNVGNSHFVKWYCLNESEMTALENWLNSSERPTGYKALDNIIAVSEFMLDILGENVSGYYDDNYVKIGTETYDTPLKRMIQIKRIVDLGNYTIDRFNNDFTDYAPYSTYKVYIPYCGWAELDSDVVVGETINVKLIVDPISTGCKGVVLCKGNIIAEINGTCGNSIPISSNNMGMQRQALLNTAVGVVSSAASVATGALTGNGLAVGGGLIGAVGSLTQALSNAHTSFNTVKGTTGTATNYNTYNTCVIQITHSVENIPSNYGSTVGFITNKTKILEECTGYVVCENVNIDGLSCDFAAKQRIKALLETGIYC